MKTVLTLEKESSPVVERPVYFERDGDVIHICVNDWVVFGLRVDAEGKVEGCLYDSLPSSEFNVVKDNTFVGQHSVIKLISPEF